MKYKRIFVIVMDSAGIGAMKDAEKFGDAGTNTFVHTSEKCGGLNIPTLNSLGIRDLGEVVGTTKVEHKHAYSMILNEASNGKDTMTGHWEMMGIHTTKPFKTFTETGFPPELIKELEERTGHKVIGNYASSGTEILVELGEEQMRTGNLIVYTSADSVLQIAAHEEVTGVKELYRCCEIARDICMKPEYLLGRIIARPFLGTDKNNFKRTSNRHDYALSPSGITAMNILKDNGYEVSCIGKIYDIFNGSGATRTQKTVSNIDGMNKTIEECKNMDYKGLCFVNLVEFDSEYGHRRNPLGYGKAIEDFDKQLKELLEVLHDDDLVMITADHGNDPTHIGTDHTREHVPLLCYSKSIVDGKCIDERNTFADIGATILENFGLNKADNMIGTPIKELLK
ncbi:MAG: phosphopentomutase [Erysipelotrichales bacterium]|nr:phosphopentomutase [Erysipelotrichales bacterium]